jgi:hypothetical protein
MDNKITFEWSPSTPKSQAVHVTHNPGLWNSSGANVNDPGVWQTRSVNRKLQILLKIHSWNLCKTGPWLGGIRPGWWRHRNVLRTTSTIVSDPSGIFRLTIGLVRLMPNKWWIEHLARNPTSWNWSLIGSGSRRGWTRLQCRENLVPRRIWGRLNRRSKQISYVPDCSSLRQFRLQSGLCLLRFHLRQEIQLEIHPAAYVYAFDRHG